MYCSKLGPTERHDQHHHRRPRSNSSPCFRNFKLKLKFFYLLCLRTLCDLKGFINQGWEMIDSSRGHGTEQGWNWDSQTLMGEWCWWEALGVWPVRRAGWAVLCHAPNRSRKWCLLDKGCCNLSWSTRLALLKFPTSSVLAEKLRQLLCFDTVADWKSVAVPF